jgi:glycosyltransferase involved in cell wall biosynthesis
MTALPPRLRIAILAHNLRAAGGLSVGRNVIASLARVADGHEYLIFLPGGLGYETIEKPSGATCHYFGRESGYPGQMWFERVTMPKMIHEFRADVVWGLGNFGLRRPGAKQAILVHKPHYIYGREAQRRELWRYRLVNAMGRRRLQVSLPTTQLVFCQTRTACERFRRTFGYAGKIALMPNAVSKLSLAGDAARRPVVFDGLDGRFVLLCLTRYYAHKNLEVLADLFLEHAAAVRDVVILVTVAANQHPRAGRFMERLGDRQLRDRLINVGPIDQSDLAGYYAHCRGLILPTLLESFSGTYLEAMQFGRPILTSDRDFARDVCGPAARYFDPKDPASIRDAILELKTSPQLRDTLVAAGAERMQAFFRDWDTIVADAVKELESLVIAGQHPPTSGSVPSASGPGGD